LQERPSSSATGRSWASAIGCLELAEKLLELKYAPNYFPINIKDLNFKS
jgi:hypothetical protein